MKSKKSGELASRDCQHHPWDLKVVEGEGLLTCVCLCGKKWHLVNESDVLLFRMVLGLSYRVAEL